MPEIADLQPRQVHGLGWIPSIPDPRDQRFQPEALNLASLPHKVDLRLTPSMGWDVLNQLQLGSCTANAISGAIQFQERQQGDKVLFAPSRLLIYYAERLLEGTIASDSGAALRDGIKVVNKLGYVDESRWPYDISKFATRPPLDVFGDAHKTRVFRYQRIQQDLQHMKAWLAGGHPFVGGITVTSSFPMQPIAGLGAGQVPMPTPYDSVEGGHALLWCGYDDAIEIQRCTGAFVFRNSWGQWGDDTYGYVPYAYLTNPSLAQDFWGITLES